MAPVLSINTEVVAIYGGTAELDGSTTVEKTNTGSRSRIDCTVLFAKDSDRLRPGGKEKLDRLARQLRDQGPGKLRITGYTDDLGPAAHGLDLSRRRAARVAEQLRHRLPANAYPMDVRGRGEANPAVPNTSEANRRKNRRVVVTLTLTPTTPRAQTPSRPTPAPTPKSPPTLTPSPSATPSRATSTPAAPTATTSAAAPPPPPVQPPPQSPTKEGPTPWPLIAGAGFVLVAGGAADLAVRRHRRHSPPATGRVESTPAPAGPTTPPERGVKGRPGEGGHTNNESSQPGPQSTPRASADLAWSRPGTAIVYGQARTKPPADASTDSLAGEIVAATTTPIRVDPQLDRDVGAWLGARTSQPRLTVLGPVRARTWGQAIARRKPYYTELLAYLALRPNGATAEEMAATFNITTPRVRTDMKILRDWLGPNPTTGRPYLPDARDSPAAKQRGVAVYQVEDVLCDWQLFERLRDRAGRTTGQSRINDLEQALQLVQGRPFDHLRANGWNWALTTDRLDQEVTLAIVNTAHTVFAYHQDRHNETAARRAAQVAAAAAPHEDGPRHDLEALASIAGRSS